jgi:hypothetical protein
MTEPTGPIYNPTPHYAPPPGSARLTQIKIAAIILIVFEGLAWFHALVAVGYRIFTGIPVPPPGLPATDLAGYQFGFWASMILGGTTILLAPFIILGAACMLRKKARTFALAASIMAMLPLTSYCCCFVTLPIGIWLLVLLTNAQVKEAFS